MSMKSVKVVHLQHQNRIWKLLLMKESEFKVDCNKYQELERKARSRMAKVLVLEKKLSEKDTEILKLKGEIKFGETSNEDAIDMDKEDSVSDGADVSEFESSVQEGRSKKKKTEEV